MIWFGLHRAKKTADGRCGKKTQIWTICSKKLGETVLCEAPTIAIAVLKATAYSETADSHRLLMTMMPRDVWECFSDGHSS